MRSSGTVLVVSSEMTGYMYKHQWYPCVHSRLILSQRAFAKDAWSGLFYMRTALREVSIVSSASELALWASKLFRRLPESFYEVVTNLKMIYMNIKTPLSPLGQWIRELLVCFTRYSMLRVPEGFPIFVSFPDSSNVLQ